MKQKSLFFCFEFKNNPKIATLRAMRKESYKNKKTAMTTVLGILVSRSVQYKIGNF